MSNIEDKDAPLTMRRECPSCGAINTIVAVELTMSKLVECSSCGTELGRWADLAEVSDNDDREEAVSEDSKQAQ